MSFCPFVSFEKKKKTNKKKLSSSQQLASSWSKNEGLSESEFYYPDEIHKNTNNENINKQKQASQKTEQQPQLVDKVHDLLKSKGLKTVGKTLHDLSHSFLMPFDVDVNCAFKAQNPQKIKFVFVPF